MDVAWIPVFVMTLSECVAPSGKTVCQPSQFELQFLTQEECELALEQLVALKEESDSVIVNADDSHCAPSARQHGIYASAEAIADAHRDSGAWRAPPGDEASPPPSRVAHEERLAQLETCDETGGRAPCKIGEIIIEGDPETEVKIWQQRK